MLAWAWACHTRAAGSPYTFSTSALQAGGAHLSVWRRSVPIVAGIGEREAHRQQWPPAACLHAYSLPPCALSSPCLHFSPCFHFPCMLISALFQRSHSLHTSLAVLSLPLAPPMPPAFYYQGQVNTSSDFHPSSTHHIVHYLIFNFTGGCSLSLALADRMSQAVELGNRHVPQAQAHRRRQLGQAMPEGRPHWAPSEEIRRRGARRVALAVAAAT